MGEDKTREMVNGQQLPGAWGEVAERYIGRAQRIFRGVKYLEEYCTIMRASQVAQW